MTEQQTAALAQRREALKSANRKRSAVAQFKRELRALPREDAANYLADLVERRVPHGLDNAVVFDLLTAVPCIGHSKASKVLRLSGVLGPDRRLREISARQRSVLANRLRWLWA